MDGWDGMGGYLRFPPDPNLSLSLFKTYPNKEIITQIFMIEISLIKVKLQTFSFHMMDLD